MESQPQEAPGAEQGYVSRPQGYESCRNPLLATGLRTDVEMGEEIGSWNAVNREELNRLVDGFLQLEARRVEQWGVLSVPEALERARVPIGVLSDHLSLDPPFLWRDHFYGGAQHDGAHEVRDQRIRSADLSLADLGLLQQVLSLLGQRLLLEIKHLTTAGPVGGSLEQVEQLQLRSVQASAVVHTRRWVENLYVTRCSDAAEPLRSPV